MKSILEKQVAQDMLAKITAPTMSDIAVVFPKQSVQHSSSIPIWRNWPA